MRVLFYYPHTPGHSEDYWMPYVVELAKRATLHVMFPAYMNLHFPSYIYSHPIAVIPFGRALGHAALDVPIWPSVVSAIRKIKPDVVHVMGEPAYTATFMLHVAVDFLMEETPKKSCRAAQNVLQYWPFPFSWLEQQVYKRTDAIFWVSRDAAQVIRSKGYQGRLYCVANGYDDTVFYPGESVRVQPPIRLLFAGNLIARKGITVLLDALTMIANMPWELSIAGKGPLEPIIRQQVHESGLASKVKFCGFLKHDKFADLVRSSHILVVPSQTSDGSDWGRFRRIARVFQVGWKEQFGKVIVECLACGVPCLGSTCGAIPETIGNAGWVVPEGDARALAEQLASLIRNPEQIEEKRQLAIKRAQDFKWGILAERTVAIWRGM